MANSESSQKAIELAIDLYESKIRDKSISASEMSAYLKLLEKKGWDRDLLSKQPADKAPIVDSLPFNSDETGDDHIIDMFKKHD